MSDDVTRRRQAAERYRPALVRLLLVAEAPRPPPSGTSTSRMFHALFREVVRAVLGEVPSSRDEKPVFLERLCDRGAFLIDLAPDPKPHPRARVEQHVPDLVERVGRLAPDNVILIKTNVYDAAFPALERAGQPVVDERIPFPGSGRQREFRERMQTALASIGWEA